MMLEKMKSYLSLLLINNIIFFLSIFALRVNSETKIIAKSGDTLIKISRRYGIPLKELMYKNNFNNATKIIEGETIVIPLKDNDKDNKNNQLKHKVIAGDTLHKIAKDYSTNIKDILSINNLSDETYLKIDQIIILPKGAIYKKLNNRENIKLASKKVFYHKTSKTETISSIAYKHRISKEEITTLNKLNGPVKINPNMKLQLRKTSPSKWLKYGSIMVNWADWTYFDGNYIALAKTRKNTSFYLAISCEKRVLNNTLNNAYWSNWYFPKDDFEFKLIDDFCYKDFKF